MPRYQMASTDMSRMTSSGAGTTRVFLSNTSALPCAIKPATCTDFLCSYRISANVPEYWNPKICGMVLHKENNILSIICSNGAKHRWKQEPYWSDIKQAAAALHVQRTGGVRIVRKDEPVLVINPETFEAQARGKLKGMESLPQWQRPDQNAGGKSL